MEESTTYQWLLEKGVVKGRVEAARRVLLIQGRTCFGPPDGATAAALEAITDIDHLEELVRRLLHVSSWQELLADPPVWVQAGPARRRQFS